MRNYRKYRVWQSAHHLVLDVYRLADQLPDTERYGLAMQMKRCAVSISSNIAEGAGRGSDRDFGRFLQIASGSVNELESQLLVVRSLGSAPVKRVEPLLAQVDQLRRQLINLIKALH